MQVPWDRAFHYDFEAAQFLPTRGFQIPFLRKIKSVGRAACSTILSRNRTFTPSSFGASIAPPLAYHCSVINEVEGTENSARQQLMATENADVQV